MGGLPDELRRTLDTLIHYFCLVCHGGFKWGLGSSPEEVLAPKLAAEAGMVTDPKADAYVNGPCPGPCQNKSGKCWVCPVAGECQRCHAASDDLREVHSAGEQGFCCGMICPACQDSII